MLNIYDFCKLISISERDEWVLKKFYKNDNRTFNDWVKELNGKITYSLIKKSSTFTKEQNSVKNNKTSSKNA